MSNNENDKKITEDKQTNKNVGNLKTFTPWIAGGSAFAITLLAGAFALNLVIGGGRHFNGMRMAHRDEIGSSYDKGMRGGMMGGAKGDRMLRRSGETVKDVNASSITVKYVDGATKTYKIDSNTRVIKSDKTYGSVSDIKTDSKVMVRSLDPTNTDPIASDIILN